MCLAVIATYDHNGDGKLSIEEMARAWSQLTGVNCVVNVVTHGESYVFGDAATAVPEGLTEAEQAEADRLKDVQAGSRAHSTELRMENADTVG